MVEDITTSGTGQEQVRGVAYCCMPQLTIQSSKSIYGRSNFSIGLELTKGISKPDVYTGVSNYVCLQIVIPTNQIYTWGQIYLIVQLYNSLHEKQDSSDDKGSKV